MKEAIFYKDYLQFAILWMFLQYPEFKNISLNVQYEAGTAYFYSEYIFRQKHFDLLKKYV